MILKIFSFILCFILFIFLTLVFVGFRAEKERVSHQEFLKKRYDAAAEYCSVTLVSMGNEKIQTIRILREYTDWSLTMAKEKVELPLPALIIDKMPADLAQELKEKLSTLGDNIIVDKI